MRAPIRRPLQVAASLVVVAVIGMSVLPKGVLLARRESIMGTKPFRLRSVWPRVALLRC